MAQIQAGTTYSEGGQVTHTNLNNHVGNAILLPGAITEQVNAVSATLADTILLQQSGALKECALTLIRDLLALGFTPVNKAGDTMTGALTVPSLTSTGAITLPSGNPPADLNAAHKLYVDQKNTQTFNTLDASKVNNSAFTVDVFGLNGRLIMPGFRIMWGITGSFAPGTTNSIPFYWQFPTDCFYADYTPRTSNASATASKAVTARDVSSFTMFANQAVTCSYDWIAFGR